MNSEAKIQELEAKVAELTAMVERLAPPTVDESGAARAEVERVTSSRRGMLKLAGAAAVGAVGAVATQALPAAAVDGGSIVIGDEAQTAQTQTALIYNGTVPAAAAGIFKVVDNPINVTNSSYPAVINGWAYGNSTDFPGRVANGIYGFSFDTAGNGVVGWGNNGGCGVLARGDRANLRLEPEGAAAPTRTGAHLLGDLLEDAQGSLWLCVAAGNPGTWRKLAGPTTSGSLHLVSPKRVYDSRAGELPDTAPKTPLSGATRTIDCTLNSSGVPAGASGLLLNVSAVSTTASGYLAVTPGGAGFTGTSTLNWTTIGAIVANSVTVATGAGATIDVTVGGGGTANFFVDVFGYYA